MGISPQNQNKEITAQRFSHTTISKVYKEWCEKG